MEKELRKLTPEDITMEEEIIAESGKLNFCLRTDFDVDAVFGTHVCTFENEDYLNVYANYDMAARQVCEELEIVLWRGDDILVFQDGVLVQIEKTRKSYTPK